MKMSNLGRTIYGYCNGFFGRDSYEDKIIIAEGNTWILVRSKDSEYVMVANFENSAEKDEYVANWAIEELA